MKHDYEYEYGRIILKPLEWDDIEQLRVLRNQEKQFFLEQTEIEEDSQKKWYERYLEKDNDIMFKVVKKDKPEEFIGAIALYAIDWEKGTAEAGRTVIDKKKSPEKGIGQEATKAVCRFGFEKLKLKKIVGEVLKTNERIIKVDLRAGFRIVGESENGELYLIEMTQDTIEL